MERAEAEAILDGDRETAVSLLLRVGELVEANQRLEARVGELERRLNRSSRSRSMRITATRWAQVGSPYGVSTPRHPPHVEPATHDTETDRPRVVADRFRDTRCLS